ncbi:MAG: tail fiber domain-containing protein [Bacteroidales bacterium]|nr:tail fiber domain-containing protein [Bacteroidales bacterium]
MRNLYLSVVLMLGTISVFSQSVGISNTAITPDASSIFEVRSTNKGVLIPRVSLTITTSAAPVTTPAVSLLVYNSATVNDVTPGYYYWNGSSWQRFFTGPASLDWTLLGNAGTNPGANFLGTTDAQDLAFRTSNSERMRILSGGNVGIGTSAPTERLHVSGNSLVSDNMYVNSTASGVVHYGNTGLFGQAVGFNPDGANNGVWLEGSNFEGGGFFANGNCAVIWSPGDNDILRVYDEDLLPAGDPRFVIDASGDVGIQAYPVSVSAALEVGGTNRGVLIPRIALTATNSASPVASPATSLLVYNTATAGVAPNNVIPGYYYWDGAQWVRFQSGTDEDWHLTGNAGTNPATNFLGTTDNQSLVFRTNNTERARFQADGTLSIGTTLDNSSNVYNRIENTDVSTYYNENNYHYGAYTGATYTSYNYNASTTNSTKYGLYNIINSTGTGARYGIYNTVSQNNTSNSTAYGMYNYLSSYGSSTNYGLNNTHYSYGTGTHYGLYNYLYLSGSTVSSPTYASYNSMQIGSSTNTTTIYGEYTTVDYSAGMKYGDYKIMNTSSFYSGTVYADYSYIAGSGNDPAYGYYSDLSISGTGAHYGHYIDISGGTGSNYGIYINNIIGTTNAYSVFANNGNAIFNESGGDYDFRVETDTRPYAMWVDANENLVRFGTSSTGSDYQNGSTIGGTVVDYVIDCANGSFEGTAVGVGSMEYLLDASAHTLINNDFCPTTNGLEDLGWGTTAEYWDDVYATSYVTVSDARAKEDIADLEYGLEEILQLRPVSYKLKNDPMHDTELGLIAQELLPVISEAVKTHDYKILSEETKERVLFEMDMMGVTYMELIPVLIKALQEEDAKVEAMEIKIEEQQQSINELQKENQDLEQRLLKLEQMMEAGE